MVLPTVEGNEFLRKWVSFTAEGLKAKEDDLECFKKMKTGPNQSVFFCPNKFLREFAIKVSGCRWCCTS